MGNLLKYLFVAMVFLTAISDKAKACSGFYIVKDSVIVAGKNTDATAWKSKIWVTPATDSTFGYVCFGFDYPFLSDGMNDRGLVVYHFSGHEKRITGSVHKPVYRGVLSELVLATCSTVEEVKVLLDKYNLSLLHNGMIMYSDRFGNSMIAEGDTIIEKRGFYQICTNIYQSEFSEDQIPCTRYLAMKHQVVEAGLFDFMKCKSILESVQQEITQFSVIYDPVDLKFSVFLAGDYQHHSDFDLTEYLEQGSQIKELYTFFPEGSRYQDIYVRRQAPQNNVIMLLLLIVSGVVIFYSLLTWPIVRIIKNFDAKERKEMKPRLSKEKALSFIICFLLASYMIVLISFKEVFQIGMPERIENFPLFIRLIVHVPVLTAVLMIPLLAVNYRVLKQSGTSSYSRWQFTTNTLTFLVLLGMFFYWGFIRVYL